MERKMTTQTLINLTPLTIETAPAGSKTALENIQRGFGFVPNLMATFANSPEVLNGYLALADQWGRTHFSPIEREVVLLAVSLENECHYCGSAHATILKGMLKFPAENVEAIVHNQATGDAKVDALVEVTRDIVSSRGKPQPATIARFLEVGFTATQLTDLLLGVGLKTISNYFDHIVGVELDPVFQGALS